MTEGRIDKALSGFYYVATAAGETLTCRARGKFRKEGLSPLVGDRVSVRELGNGEGYVEAILPRRNAFRRPAVANIDQLVIVASGAIPVTDPFLIDRMCAVAALKDCGVVLLLNKHDLDPAEELYRIYTAAGFPTLRVSAETGEGIAELKELLSGKLSAFTGNSGVGKSTLLNLLIPGLNVKTAPLSDVHDSGMHTTTFSELYELPQGGSLIDIPGVKGFGTFDFEKHEVSHYFREIFRTGLECRYSDCTHLEEPGCAVRKAVEEGSIALSRYQSYLNMLDDKDEAKYRESY